jgi:hypothetical protein
MLRKERFKVSFESPDAILILISHDIRRAKVKTILGQP